MDELENQNGAYIACVANGPALNSVTAGIGDDKLGALTAKCLIPRLRHQHVAVAMTCYMCKAWKMHVHSRDKLPVGCHHVEEALPRHGGRLRVGVVVDGHAGPSHLNLRHVDDVTPDQQRLVA
jgi:hypothetical protein